MLQQNQLPRSNSAPSEVGMKGVSSFDVFDTVLVRNMTDPTNLFLSMGRRLKKIGVDLSPAAFRASRVAAEARCRENGSAEEISLAEIYRELGHALGWDPDECQAAEQLELEVEAQTLMVNPRVLELIAAARSAGRRVVFVSDMYLPPDFIREQLKRFGVMKDGDRCYVSSERMVTKSSGGLFQCLLEEENVAPAAIIHVGDHPHSDDACPRSLGIATQPYVDARPNRYEKLMDSFAVETDGFSSMFAGAARSARLEGPRGAGAERDSILWEASTGVVGPILSAYVLWVLDQARKSGIERLYFLSRDGYILHRLAERLAPAIGVSVELRYLYGSRQAWHLPAIKRLGREHLGWLLDRTHQMTVRTVLARVEVQPEEAAADLIAGGFPAADWGKPIRENELSRLAEILLRPSVAKVVNVRAESRRGQAVAYLTQEGLMDGTRWSLVDLGWHGRLQSSLALLVGTSAPQPLSGYYFALFDRPAKAGELKPFFFDQQEGLGPLNSPLTPIMMEMFCTAPHGTTIGYSDRGDRIEPMLSPSGDRLEKWGVKVVHQATLTFADHLARFLHDRPHGGDSRPMITELIRAWWLKPERSHARVWSDFPYEDDQAGGDCQPVAASYSWAECLQACWRHGVWRPRSRAEWQSASATLTSPAKRFSVALARRCCQVLRPVRNQIRRFLMRAFL